MPHLPHPSSIIYHLHIVQLGLREVHIPVYSLLRSEELGVSFPPPSRNQYCNLIGTLDLCDTFLEHLPSSDGILQCEVLGIILFLDK